MNTGFVYPACDWCKRPYTESPGNPEWLMEPFTDDEIQRYTGVWTWKTWRDSHLCPNCLAKYQPGDLRAGIVR